MTARIISLLADLYKIQDLETKEVLSGKATGLFRYKKMSPKVGDIVEYDKLPDNQIYITKIHDRKNDLVRPAISNIDQAIVVMSVLEPSFNDNLLDRFLTILEFNNIDAIILFSKWDLLDKVEEMEKVFNYYKSLGYQCYKVSTKLDTFDNKQISSLFKGKVSVLTGQSGVGKSSLLNYLYPNLTLKTNEISKALGRGKHTTRHVELLELSEGLVADTPGFGTMDFSGFAEIDIMHSFKEFFEYSKECKYNGCLHIKEPHCMVKAKLDSGEILKTRYTNYLQFIEECKKLRKW